MTEQVAMTDFALDRFLELSKAVQLDDLDWEEARCIGITATEARILRYMADTEAHTIIYMRDLLAGHSARDPEVTAFLCVWVYEEFWHARALDRFLSAVGYAPAPDHYTRLRAGTAVSEVVEAVLSHALAYLTPRFAATHMAWGAINELTTAAAYAALERRTANPVLAALCARLAKQERKHFSFYYHQAQRRLQGDRLAQKICTFALKRFWDPVGAGVSDRGALALLAAALFGDERGRRAIIEADATIATLPGLSWFDMIERAVGRLRQGDARTSGAQAMTPASIKDAATPRS
jgi:rubrerythrin